MRYLFGTTSVVLATIASSLAAQTLERPIGTHRLGTATIEVSAVDRGYVRIWATQGIADRVLLELEPVEIQSWLAATRQMLDTAVSVSGRDRLIVGRPSVGTAGSMSVTRTANANGSSYSLDIFDRHVVHHVHAAPAKIGVLAFLATMDSSAKEASRMTPAAPLAAAESGQTYFEFQVDKPAAPDPSNRPPRTETVRGGGEVLVQFEVNQYGAPVISSLKVLRSIHTDLEAEVPDILRAWRFSPAEIDGRTVRQLVQMSIVFLPSSPD